jgi:hypothetical protein
MSNDSSELTFKQAVAMLFNAITPTATIAGALLDLDAAQDYQATKRTRQPTRPDAASQLAAEPAPPRQ